MASHCIEVIQKSKDLSAPVATSLKTFEFDDEKESLDIVVRKACEFAYGELYRHMVQMNEQINIEVIDQTTQKHYFIHPSVIRP